MTKTHSIGLVVGKFWQPHRGHQLLLETAAAQVSELVVLVYANPDSATQPAAVRAQWLRELYRGDELTAGPRIGTTPLRIFALSAEADEVPPDAADDYTQREFVRQWLAQQAIKVDVVFSSEAYGPGFAEHLGVPHTAVDGPPAGTGFGHAGTWQSGGFCAIPAPVGGGAAGRGAATNGALRGIFGG